MRYFDRLRTSQSVIKRYRELAKRHHPDVGGNPDVMKAINNEYREALARIASLQARREAEKSKAGQGMAGDGKTRQRSKEGASFYGGTAPNVQNEANGMESKTNLQNAQQGYISDEEKAARGKLENAATDFIRAGAQLFGEMAASWLKRNVSDD